MKRLGKDAIILKLIDSMHEKESWCGETHLQKAVYFLEELTNVPLELNFILYKHGPFSFDLRDELTAMQADELLEVRPQLSPYGPKLFNTGLGKRIQDHFPKTLREYKNQIEFVAEHLGDKKVTELERLGTALYVTKKHADDDAETRAKHISSLKPHISPPEAIAAVKDVDQMQKEFSVA